VFQFVSAAEVIDASELGGKNGSTPVWKHNINMV
jgi:hypothetical protein